MKNLGFKFLLLLTIGSTSLSCKSDQKPHLLKTKDFKISGTYNGTEDTVFLHRLVNNKYQVVDSIPVHSKHFFFKGEVNTPEMAFFSTNRSDLKPLFLDQDSISIELVDTIKTLNNVTGSKAHDKWLDFQTAIKPYDLALDSLDVIYYALKDEGKDLDAIIKEYDEMDSIKYDFIKQTIYASSADYISPYLSSKYFYYIMDASELEGYYNPLTAEVKASAHAQFIKNRIAEINKTKVGTTVPEFTQTDLEGNNISINSFRGKFVLIDFWASWCGPCRRENPNVVKAYNAFKDKNFTVLGISFDTKKENWMGAIEKDQLTWTHLSDLKGWDNNLADIFGVKSIPFSILIDPKGKIIAKNLSGEELYQFLNEKL